MIFVKFDQWILEEGFQRFTDWFQKLTGKDCFWVSFTILKTLFASAVSVVLVMTYQGFGSVLLNSIDTGILISIWFGCSAIDTKMMQTRAYQALSKGLQNPQKQAGELRLLMALTSVILGSLNSMLLWQVEDLQLLLFAGSVSIVCFVSPFLLYIISCTLLPPAPSKLGE